MRKIYDEYFHVPEQGEGAVREKVFFSRLILSIVCMLVCMIAIGYNAYAFFTTNIESTANILQAATYSLEVMGKTVPEGVGSYAAEPEPKYTFRLNEGTYDFTFTKSQDSTAKTGYAKIVIGESSFYTQQIGGVYDAENKEITTRTIRIKVDVTTEVQFIECWGTYSGNTSTPTAEEVIVEKQNMIEVKGTNISSVAWAEPQYTNNSNSPSPAPNAETQTPANDSESNDEGNASQVEQTESSQTQEDSQNIQKENVEETPSTN